MRARTILIFVLVAVCSAAAQSGCISGLVLDDRGNPLANMNVLVSRHASSQWWLRDTDDKGHFQLEGLPPGNYTIVTRNHDLGYPDTNFRDFTGIDYPPEYTLKDSAPCLNLTIRREPPAGRLHLKLTDQDKGTVIEEPQAQFHITQGLYGWHPFMDGRELLVPPLKPVEVRVGAKGYQTTTPVSIPPLKPGEVRDYAVALKPIGLGCLKGKVLDAKGQPVVKIRVDPLLVSDNLNSRSLSVLTDSHGDYEMHDLPTGHYSFSVYGKEQGYDSSSLVQPGGRFPQTDVSASPACADVTLNLKEPNGRLAAEVLDAETQLPLKRFRFVVTCPALKRWRVEGRDFNREIQIPTGNSCSVQADFDGYITSDPVALEPFKPAELRKITFHLHPVHPPNPSESPNSTKPKPN